MGEVYQLMLQQSYVYEGKLTCFLHLYVHEHSLIHIVFLQTNSYIPIPLSQLLALSFGNKAKNQGHYLQMSGLLLEDQRKRGLQRMIFQQILINLARQEQLSTAHTARHKDTMQELVRLR